MKTSPTEIIACVAVLLLGVWAAALLVEASYLAANAHDPSSEGDLIAITFGAAVVLPGLGSLCAFIAKKEESARLRHVWLLARWLNFAVFFPCIAYALWIYIETKMNGQA